MARPARLLGDLPAVRFDLNIVLVAAGGEEKRMPEAVGRLSCILADEICRRVAVIAGCNRAVRRLEPTVELLAHDVAVGAGRRVIRQIRPAPGVGESICADADSDADNHPEENGLNCVNLHLDCLRRIANGSKLPGALRGALYWVASFPPRIEAHQASNQHRQEKLSSHSLDDGKPARDITSRYRRSQALPVLQN
jgi:hypothetical protein